MAKELSQEEVLDFLCQRGGKVVNASLLVHFKRFLRDPQATDTALQKRRDKFKRYVNSVAVVRQEGSVKYVVLRNRYRDLLGEEIQPPVPAAEDVGIEVERDQVVLPTGHGQDYLAPPLGEERLQQTNTWRRGDVILDYSEAVPSGISRSHSWDVGESIGEKTRVSPSQWNTKRSYPEDPPIADSRPVSPLCTRTRQSSFTSRSPVLTFRPPTHSLSSNNLSSSFSSPESPGPFAKTYNSSLSLTGTRSSLNSKGQPPGRQGFCEAANAACVSVTCTDLKVQREGCPPCTELLAPQPIHNWEFPQPEQRRVLSAQAHNSDLHREHMTNGFYLPDSPSSRYPHPTQPRTSLQLLHEADITPDDQAAVSYPSPPLSGNDMYGMCMCQIPVFRSIRCQLSLQDLDDFVDQETCGSEESDSGEGGDCDTEPREDDDFSSDSHKERPMLCAEKESEHLFNCHLNMDFNGKNDLYNSLQEEDSTGMKDTLVEHGNVACLSIDTNKSIYTAKSFLTDQAPVLFELARNVPPNKTSSCFLEAFSSSDEELLDRDYRKRRRSSHYKKSGNVSVSCVQPDTDRLLTAKFVNSSSFLINNNLWEPNSQAQCIPKANSNFDLKKSASQKSSVVPLDPKEHEWIVKTATGLWIQVYGMFSIDPHLALHKDFITGYTALHWFAKHGCIDLFNKVVFGAKKAGIELDVNVKSSNGYTPLHIAAIHGHHKVAVMLVEKLKVNVKARDNSGKKAWQYLNTATSGEVWQLLGAPKGKTIFASRALHAAQNLSIRNKTSSQLTRKSSLAAFRKTQHQRWKENNQSFLREREIYSD
ncbi:ankyrin repeat domain-containing protein SOWAHB-like [Xenopus laevis]|uniref:SOWAHA-C winged helix-turn-helix domain-containing protein n=2 Tax=Xenopus laevis TaxID=8355 RepID=A0A974DTN8_XENLA|nr:ankyrin repeat domain-containing protein SOWAHB-like [Xenopus laevis]OCT97300.1 hypothetical protein XELAEV_18009526mg [Xenopus laevis]